MQQFYDKKGTFIIKRVGANIIQIMKMFLKSFYQLFCLQKLNNWILTIKM